MKYVIIFLIVLALCVVAFVFWNNSRMIKNEDLPRTKLENTNIEPIPQTLPPREFVPPEQFKDKGSLDYLVG